MNSTKESIPKVIHYCWFGGNPLPKAVEKCINSWKKYLPDYKIKEWNENNFPIENYIFAKQALEKKKFAFVSDVARLHALKNEGGIYMDTDVEVIKPLDELLNQTAFTGFETDDYLSSCVIGSVKNGKWVEDFLSYYINRNFINEDGSLETISNTSILTKLMFAKGIKMNNTFQTIDNYVTFYTKEYFSPKSYINGALELTDNTYSIHHFAKTWIPAHKRIRNNLKMKVMNIFGDKFVQNILNVLKRK